MVEKKFLKDIDDEVIGVDEVGRGSLAGPVVSCAVLLNKKIKNNVLHKEIDDSKKISEKKREILSSEIIKNAIDYSFYHVSVEMIDTLNIFNASILAMNKTIENLKTKP